MPDIPQTRFGDICAESAFGPRFSSDNYAADGNVATLRTTDMRVDGRIDYESMPLAKLDLDPLKNHLLRRGDLCMTRTGRVGTTAVFEAFGLPVLPGAFLIRFRLKPTVADPFYFQYFFNSPEGQRRLLATASGSVQQNLNITALHEVLVPLPPLVEQEEIAGVLRSLDDKIEQNRRTGRALEALTRATFKAWFVDFEPVKAKAAGAASFPGIPHAAFAALPGGLADSPLGPVPHGWAVGKLGSHCGINQRSVRAGQIDGEIEYIDIASVTVGRLDGVQRVPFAEAPSRARRQVRHGDTIWSCVRPNRRSYLFIHSPPESWIVSTGFAVLSPASFGPSYLHELTTRQEFVDYLVANADGSAYPAVRPDHFARADVLVPPAELRDAFEEVTMPLRNLLAAGEAESSTLATLRDYLLPRLLSGRVRVRPSRAGAKG